MVRTIAHSRPTGVFFVPVAAVRLLRRFRTLLHSGSQALALLAGDCDARVALGTDSGHEGREHEFEFAQISPHPNCFTLPVDFELLRSWFADGGGGGDSASGAGGRSGGGMITAQACTSLQVLNLGTNRLEGQCARIAC